MLDFDPNHVGPKGYCKCYFISSGVEGSLGGVPGSMPHGVRKTGRGSDRRVHLLPRLSTLGFRFLGVGVRNLDLGRARCSDSSFRPCLDPKSM